MQSYFVDPSECSEHQIFPGVNIRTSWCERMMLSLVTFEPHAVVEPHSHEHEQIGVLLEGELEFTIGGQTRRLVPGQMWRIPGGVVHSAVAGDQRVRAVDVFAPIREDYK
ncbi:MAG: cupin domain-containing protein [Pirellulales bacterium]